MVEVMGARMGAYCDCVMKSGGGIFMVVALVIVDGTVFFLISVVVVNMKFLPQSFTTLQNPDVANPPTQQTIPPASTNPFEEPSTNPFTSPSTQPPAPPPPPSDPQPEVILLSCNRKAFLFILFEYPYLIVLCFIAL